MLSMQNTIQAKTHSTRKGGKEKNRKHYKKPVTYFYSLCEIEFIEIRYDKFSREDKEKR